MTEVRSLRMPYPRLSFGAYQLDLDAGGLWRDGLPVSLRPRHLEVLHCAAEWCALAERGGARDLARARTTASASRDSAQRLGMAGLAERAGELSARLGEAADSTTQ